METEPTLTEVRCQSHSTRVWNTTFFIYISALVSDRILKQVELNVAWKQSATHEKGSAEG